MGRSRQFDREGVMDESLKAFWRNGYDRTSLEDLLKCMAINNSSFYQTFHSKEKLFIELLVRYRATFGQERLTILTDPAREPARALRDYFRHTIYMNPRRGYPVGCFMTATVGTLDDPASTVGRQALLSMRTIESNFLSVLKRAEPGPLKPVQGARLLLTFLTGLTAMSRMKKTQRELMTSAEALIDLLLKTP